MENLVLNNGVEMPILGLGVYQIDDLSVCQQTVSDALEIGYRLIDTAAVYENEPAVGAAVRESGIPRKEIFVASKLWVQDFGYDDALRGFDQSMKNLELDYIDLYMLHKPYNDYYGAWRALERLYAEGRIRAIGVTSFWNERLADFCHFQKVKPAVNQVETNVWYQQWAAQQYMQELGVQHQTWAPLAEGFNDVFNNPVLKQIGDKYGKSVVQIIIRWFIQRGISVIPKTIRKERLQENFNVFDFNLDADDMAQIKMLDYGKSILSDDMNVNEAMSMISYKFHE